MGNSFNSPGDYRIEVSGWGLDNRFFTEKTGLHWTATDEKKVQLHRALPEGATVFIRLLMPESSNGSVPVPYQVENIGPMDCNGRCQMNLKQLCRRSKESLAAKNASKGLEESPSVCDLREEERELQHEGVLQ